MAGKTTRQRYLEAVVECMLEQGRTDLPLVSLAEAAGTSDRMLVYYFKTREGLLSEAVESIRVRRRDDLLAITNKMVSRDAAPRVLDDLLRWVTSTDNEAAIRLFYDAAGRGFHQEAPFGEFLSQSLQDWVDAGTQAARRVGAGADSARSFATILAATAQAMAADRLGTGDGERVDQAIPAAVSALVSMLTPDPAD